MKKLKSNKYPLAVVDWIDSAGDNACWINKKHIRSMPPCKCRTVGFILEETKKHITLLQNISDSDEIMGRITIPQVAIKKKKILRKG